MEGLSTRADSGRCPVPHPAGRRSRPGRTLTLLATGGAALAAVLASVAATAAGPAGAAPVPFLSHFHTTTELASTVPANGDQNPYGVANVPFSTGNLVGGDTLVSNFNAKSNLQGTGTTIMQVAPSGQVSTFAQIDPATLPGQCPGGVGLTTALSVLNDGYVVVGSLPVTKEGSGTPEAGCLIVLNSDGMPVETWSGNGINGPWDMTSLQLLGPFAELFVTNVLNGTVAAAGGLTHHGTVLRLGVFEPSGQPPVLVDTQKVGGGFSEQLNSSALVLGPTGVALGQDGTLYVADTVTSRIAVIPDATTRTTSFSFGLTLTQGGNLSAPLGLATAPNGDLIAVNGNNGNAVEIDPLGQQVDTITLDPFNSGGDLFGLAIAPGGQGLLFVDDNGSANSLDLLH
jgi:NHL repeat